MKRKIRKSLRGFLLKLLFPRNNGFYVLSEQWDYLIILDACRYDVFSEEIEKLGLRGRLEYRISRGSTTVEFLLENFGKGCYPNIIYVTANPYVSMLLNNRFAKILHVWKDYWNEDLKTVHPEAVYRVALRSILENPDKKHIIHFMQPHYPFLTWRHKKETGIECLRRKAIGEAVECRYDISIWNLVARGEVSLDEVIEKYRENLRIALKYVRKLVDNICGRIVITADHGEAFGEKIHPLIPKRVYGHVGGVRIEPLVKVPWFIINKECSKDIIEKRRKMIGRLKLLRKTLSPKSRQS